MLGGPTDGATPHRIVDEAYEQGINFIDTADGDDCGEAEVIVDQRINTRR